MTVVRLNLPGITELAKSDLFDPLLEKLGEDIASDAAEAAPRSEGEPANGHMADSIHPELGHDAQGAYVRIGWDAEHWYGIFAELGTSKESARPFLRPAATKRRAL